MAKPNGAHLSDDAQIAVDELEAHLDLEDNEAMSVVVHHNAEAGRVMNKFGEGSQTVSAESAEIADGVIEHLRKLSVKERKEIGRAIAEAGYWDADVESAFEQILPGKNSGIEEIKQVAAEFRRGLSFDL